MEPLHKKKRETSYPASATSNLELVVDRAVKEFASHKFDDVTELKDKRNRVNKENDTEIDWKRVEKGDTMCISSKFDSVEWWKNLGKDKNPLIFLAALRIIALPVSNAFVERVFSACTWFDDPLRQ